MKFFHLGLHIGIADIENIFKQLGHQLDICSLSNHNSIMGWKTPVIDIINQQSWRFFNQEMCDRFYDSYKNKFNSYDGFVTFYPPVFSLLFEKFNKPIIMVVPLRFDIPFVNDGNSWNWFINGLKKGISNRQIKFVVNNKLDQQYFKNYTGYDIQYISNLCEYTNMKYVGDKEEFLYCSKFKQLPGWLPNISMKMQQIGYSWQDLVRFKALVYIPYTNTTMSFVEQYMMGIPMLFPSKDFLIRLWEQFKEEGVMSELSHKKIFGYEPKTPINVTFEGLDLNDYNNKESFIYWSGLSDCYDQENYPHIQYYDTIFDLEFKLLSLDFKDISARMKQFNITKKQKVLYSWKKTLDSL